MDALLVRRDIAQAEAAIQAALLKREEAREKGLLVEVARLNEVIVSNAEEKKRLGEQLQSLAAIKTAEAAAQAQDAAAAKASGLEVSRDPSKAHPASPASE